MVGKADAQGGWRGADAFYLTGGLGSGGGLLQVDPSLAKVNSRDRAASGNADGADCLEFRLNLLRSEGSRGCRRGW